MLVIARVIARGDEKRNFHILWPIEILEGDKIPQEYDRNIEIWGRPAYKELKRRRVKRK